MTDDDGNPVLGYPGDYNVAVPGHRDIAYREEVLAREGIDRQVLTFTTPGTHVETPQRAVQLLQDKNYVWIVDSAGTARQRDVKMGQQQGSDWVVEEGLAPGDIVVVDGTQKLKAGTPVRIQPLPAPTPGPRAS